MSSKNPFRQPPPSEPEVTVVPPSPGQRSPSTNPPTLPPRSPTSGPSSQSQILASPPSGPATHLGTSTSPTIAEIIEDDLPPPYTPSPNVSIGEETVGLGPPRPFQPPPPQPPSSLHPPAESHSYSNRPPRPLQPNPTGPVSYSSAYSQPYPQSDMASWQTQQQYRQRQNGGGGLIGALLDTVRDIADTFSGAHDDLALQRGNTGGYTAPGSYSSTNAMYAPPPGSRLPPRRPASTPPRSPPTIPDDGSPTRTPAPGHPLLRDGYLLVYPRDYLCVKCRNTGFKNYDPSHPCRKCWEKHSKPYTGALAYTPWSSSGNDSRLQRPLPKFVPPHMAGLGPESSSSSAYAPAHPFQRPPQHPHHSRSVSQPHHTPSPGPSYYVTNPLSPWDSTPPVPDAIAVSPGDPRLGGRLCMQCRGAGIRTLLLIEVTTCDRCGGTGRIWM